MTCPQCDQAAAQGSRFCPACGADLVVFSPPTSPPPAVANPPGTSGKAVASLVLGVVGLIAWCVPIVGLPVTIIGVVLGSQSLNTPSRGLALAGLVLSVIGLAASAVNAVIGAYLGATGQMPWQQ